MIIELTTSAGSEVRAFTERYAAAWNEGDVDAIAQMVTDDIVWADPALPEPARGIAAVQEFMRVSFRAFPDLHFSEADPPHLTVTDEEIAWAWRMEGTMKGVVDPPGFAPTGRKMRVEGVDLWRMRDGRIADYRAFYDVTGVARQLGILPPSGSRAERATVALQHLQARFLRR